MLTMMARRVAVVLGIVAGVVSTTAPMADAAHRSAAKSQVYVIQGVPGSRVDVTVDGSTVGHKVAAKGIVGPLDLSRGRHSVTFTSPDWKITSAFSVSRSSVDVVVHWPADITKVPEVTVFNNNVKPVPIGKGRVTIAHTAVVPPADLRVDHKVLFSNIANGEFVTADVPGTTYDVDIVPTGQKTDPLLGPVDLKVKPGALTRVFAIGQPKDGSMDVIVQVLPLATVGSRAPSVIEAGEAGLVATSRIEAPAPSGRLPVIAILGVLTALGLVGNVMRRRARP